MKNNNKIRIAIIVSLMGLFVLFYLIFFFDTVVEAEKVADETLTPTQQSEPIERKKVLEAIITSHIKQHQKTSAQGSKTRFGTYKTAEKIFNAGNEAIELYVKIVDQFGEPVIGATAIVAIIETFSAGETKYKRIISDASGLFTLSNEKGWTVDIREIIKEGYESSGNGLLFRNYKESNEDVNLWKETTATKPFEIRLFKKPQATNLIRHSYYLSKQKLLAKTIHFKVVTDKSIKHSLFCEKKKCHSKYQLSPRINNKTQLFIWESDDLDTDFSISLSNQQIIIDGQNISFQKILGQYPYTPPLDGYQSRLLCDFSRLQCNKNLYFKRDDMFGSIKLSISSANLKTSLSISLIVNPEREANLYPGQFLKNPYSTVVDNNYNTY